MPSRSSSPNPDGRTLPGTNSGATQPFSTPPPLVPHDERLPDRARSRKYLSPIGSPLRGRPNPLKINSRGYSSSGSTSGRSPARSPRRSPVRSPVGSLMSPMTPATPGASEGFRANTPRAHQGSTSTKRGIQRNNDEIRSVHRIYSPRLTYSDSDSSTSSQSGSKSFPFLNRGRGSSGQVGPEPPPETSRCRGTSSSSSVVLSNSSSYSPNSSQPNPLFHFRRVSSSAYNEATYKRHFLSPAASSPVGTMRPYISRASSDVRRIANASSMPLPSTDPYTMQKAYLVSRNSEAAPRSIRTISGRTRNAGNTFHSRRMQKKAVIIGISYLNNNTQETSWIHGRTTKMWCDVLVKRLEFISEEIWLLSDMNPGDTGTHTLTASSANIGKAMDWLTKDVNIGDRLFMAYNGNIACDVSVDDADLCNPPVHALVPCDYPKGRLIWEEEINAMIHRVPNGVDLHLFFDGRKSWNIVRLPCIYLPFKESRQGHFEIREPLTPSSCDIPEFSEKASKVLKTLTKAGKEKERAETERQKEYQQAQLTKYESATMVVSFGTSPIKYKKFRINVVGIKPLEKGEYTETFIRSIERIIHIGQPLTYRKLLLEMAGRLSPPGYLGQVPQICATRELDMDKVIPL